MGASLCKVNCCNIWLQRALYIQILHEFCHCLPEFLLLRATFIILQPSGGKLQLCEILKELAALTWIRTRELRRRYIPWNIPPRTIQRGKTYSTCWEFSMQAGHWPKNYDLRAGCLVIGQLISLISVKGLDTYC